MLTFPSLSVISLPDSDAALQKAVDSVYEDFLQYAESSDEVKKERRKQKVAAVLEGFTDEVVWAEIQRRQGGQGKQYKGIKQVEIETLLSSPFEVGEDVPESDFYARARKLDNIKPKLLSLIESIVLVHRLKEVTAQIGFTRFEAIMPDIDGDLDIQVRRAALDIEPTGCQRLKTEVKACSSLSVKKLLKIGSSGMQCSNGERD